MFVIEPITAKYLPQNESASRFDSSTPRKYVNMTLNDFKGETCCNSCWKSGSDDVGSADFPLAAAMWTFTKLLLGLTCLWSSWPFPNLPVWVHRQETTEAPSTRQSFQVKPRNGAFSAILGQSTAAAANWATFTRCLESFACYDHVLLYEHMYVKFITDTYWPGMATTAHCLLAWRILDVVAWKYRYI